MPCREARDTVRAHAFHNSLREWRILPSMAATAVHVRPPGPARARRLRSVGDDRLVARVRAGDDAAFEIIYDRYHRGLLAFCGHMLGSRQEAEDALQHSFASAYRALRAGAGDIDLRPWLYTIARNRCLSALRAQRAQVSADGLAAEVGPFEGMSAQVQLRADLRELVDELQRLPDDQRAALVLFELGDESHAQIAAVLGVRREKVKALVFQAREALMRARDARATPCVEIREQLAIDAGRVPRRSVARRHIDRCPGCADFEREVRRQRAAFAAILPLVPTVGLKSSVLGFALGGGGGAVALGGAGAGGGATVAAGGALAAGGVGGGGIAGSAGAAAAGAIGTAGAASVATGLATGGGGVGLASLPTKAVVAKILSVVALGGGGAQAQVHSDRPTRPPAIHQPALRASAAVPAYPPSPRKHLPAGAPAAIQATPAASPVAAPEASAPAPASSSTPAPAASHAPATSAPATPTSSSPSSSAAPATAATPAPSEPPAATPAPASASTSSAPIAGATTTPSIAATASPTPAPVPAPAPAPAPAPSPSTAAAAAVPADGAGTTGAAAPAADSAAASASAAAVAAS
jgi:RNA polymerase sigma factor (sigma-70 family)